MASSFPRVITLVLVLPLLTILADVIAIAGGLLVAMLGLDITANAYLIETQKAVGLWDVSSGCVKTVFFGASIALVACQRGLAARGGAEGVRPGDDFGGGDEPFRHRGRRRDLTVLFQCLRL